MSVWLSAKARRVLAALERLGWRLKRTSRSHRALERAGWPDLTFAAHEGDEIAPHLLARIARASGLKPDDL